LDGKEISGDLNIHSTVDLGQITIRHVLGRLVADTDLETSWAPVNELNSPLGLDASNGGVNFLGHNITTVQQASGHVFASPRVTLHHLVGWLEAHRGDLLDCVGLVARLVGGNNRRVGDEREVNARVRDQVGLELVQVDIERTVEAKRGSDGGDNLSDQAV